MEELGWDPEWEVNPAELELVDKIGGWLPASVWLPGSGCRAGWPGSHPSASRPPVCPSTHASFHPTTVPVGHPIHPQAAGNSATCTRPDGMEGASSPHVLAGPNTHVLAGPSTHVLAGSGGPAGRPAPTMHAMPVASGGSGQASALLRGAGQHRHACRARGRACAQFHVWSSGSGAWPAASHARAVRGQASAHTCRAHMLLMLKPPCLLLPALPMPLPAPPLLPAMQLGGCQAAEAV